MIKLIISPDEEFRLKFDTTEIERFTDCEMQLVKGEEVENVYEDYLYVFIAEMMARLKNIPVLTNGRMFGKIGEWQEPYLFKDKYTRKHKKKITITENARFVGTARYGLFLYQYDGKIWLEMDEGVDYSDKSEKYSAIRYYSTPDNYRVLFTNIPPERIEEWKKELEKIEEIIRPDWL